jgi:hypothetical protein
MNYKLYGGLLLLVIGIYLILSGIGTSHEVEASKDFAKKVSDFFTNNPTWNPLIKFFGGTPIKELPKHTTSPTMRIVIGSFLTLIGAAFAYVYRKKR